MHLSKQMMRSVHKQVGTGVRDVYSSQVSMCTVNNSLFFCTYSQYLHRVSVLFFRDVIEYEHFL